MKKNELQKLAQKIQLEIGEEELMIYLKNFDHLEKLLDDFKKLKIGREIESMERIDVGCLDLKQLKKLKKKFFQTRISKKNQKKNSLITDDDFVLFKK